MGIGKFKGVISLTWLRGNPEECVYWQQGREILQFTETERRRSHEIWYWPALVENDRTLANLIRKCTHWRKPKHLARCFRDLGLNKASLLCPHALNSICPQLSQLERWESKALGSLSNLGKSGEWVTLLLQQNWAREDDAVLVSGNRN